MANKTFSAGVRGWAKHTKAQMREILHDSVMDILEGVMTSQPSVEQTGGTFNIGEIPVKDGDLIKSLVSELNGMKLGEGPVSYELVVAQMKAGDMALFSFTAPHARAIEYGWTTSTGKEVGGRQYVGANAARWPEVVDENAKRIFGK